MNLTLTDHARHTSFPLRYGFIPSGDIILQNSLVEEAATNAQRKKEIDQGNKVLVGEITCDGFPRGRAKLVVSENQKIITALPLDDSYASGKIVSDYIDEHRKNGTITPQYICDRLYPLYARGELDNGPKLIAHLVSLGLKHGVEKLKLDLESAQHEVAVMKSQQAVDEEKIRAQQERIEMLEKAKQNYSGEVVAVAQPAKLRSATHGFYTKKNGEKIDSICLSFDGVSAIRYMYARLDRGGKIFEKAKKLEGAWVQTTVWNPTRFPSRDWFIDIYEATSPSLSASSLDSANRLS